MSRNELITRAEQSDPKAQHDLGLFFMNPQNGEIDVAKAFYWFTKSAEQGFADAQYYLGDFYENIKRELPNAIKWYKAAAEQGHIHAQCTLGYCYERGIGVNVDFVESVKWHKKAAEQGSAVAQNNLAMCHEHGKGTAQNLSEAIKWYTKAAEQGSPLKGVQNDLGLFYMTGNGVEVDEQKAVYWLSKAVENNEIPAFANLGRCYLNGIGVEKDLPKALSLFTRAIRYGIDDAERYLFEHVDIMEILLLSATGNAQAQYFAAKWHFKRSVSRAVELLQKSAEQDEPLSMFVLGLILAEPSPERDLFKTEELLVRAADLGYKKAADFLREIREIIAFETPYYLVKIIDKQWAEKLLDGEVFMRSISCFVNFPSANNDPTVQNSFRGDHMEGFTKSFGKERNPLGLIMDDSDRFQNYSTGLIDSLLLREKIFCLYAYEFDEATQCFVKPDSQLLDFGDTAVIITDTTEFLRRVSEAIKARFGSIDYYMSYRRVTYDVEFSSGEAYNEFHKSKRYMWQKEFRVALDLTEGKFDKKTLESVTDDAIIQHLDACGKLGIGKPATKPLTADERKKYEERRFRDMIETDENPDSVNDSLTLNIGDIRDICIAMPMKQFVELQNVDFFIDKGFKPPAKVVQFTPPRQPKPTFFRGISSLSKEQRNMELWRKKWRDEGLIDS